MGAVMEVALIYIFKSHIYSLPLGCENAREDESSCRAEQQRNVLIETKPTYCVRLINAKSFDEEAPTTISSNIESKERASSALWRETNKNESKKYTPQGLIEKCRMKR